jgi:hypothetical protein
MRAILALIALYVVTFFVAVSTTPRSSQAAPPDADAPQEQAGKTAPVKIDAAKEADIRSLMELTGAADLLQEAVEKAGGQHTQRIETLVQDPNRAQKLSAAFLERYKAHFRAEEMTDELVRLYDKHFSAAEIKGLLQFYGSPLGQKYAAEMPRLGQEAQAAGTVLSQRAAKEAWQDLRAQNPELGAGQRAGRRP